MSRGLGFDGRITPVAETNGIYDVIYEYVTGFAGSCGANLCCLLLLSGMAGSRAWGTLAAAAGSASPALCKASTKTSLRAMGSTASSFTYWHHGF